MLVLRLSALERVVIETPAGNVTLQLMDHHRVGIDAPKAWGVTRIPHYSNNVEGVNPAALDDCIGKHAAGAA
jgi:hypothetical protein